MTEKERASLDYAAAILKASPKPIVLCSFGKDSMVMLHLLRRLRPDLPVLFFREPFFPKKYAFANSVIEKWGLSVYDFPPFSTDFMYRNGVVEIGNWHNAYKNAWLYLPTGVCGYGEGEDFLCSVEDLLKKPRVIWHSFPWDTVFIGHKNGDRDPMLGTTRLTERTVKARQMTIALPLMDWSDADVWDYTVRYKVPFNSRRYDKDNGFREFEDKTYNNDYHPSCFKCLDPREGEFVECPKRPGVFLKNRGITTEQSEDKLKNLLLQANYVKSDVTEREKCPERELLSQGG